MYVPNDGKEDYQKYLDVAHETWVKGYNPNAVNPDIIQSDIINHPCEDVDELTKREIGRQKRT